MVAAPQGFNVGHMLQPALSVLVSMALGALGGTALGALLNAKPTAMPRTVAALNRVLPQAVIARYSQGLYVTGTAAHTLLAVMCHISNQTRWQPMCSNHILFLYCARLRLSQFLCWFPAFPQVGDSVAASLSMLLGRPGQIAQHLVITIFMFLGNVAAIVQALPGSTAF